MISFLGDQQLYPLLLLRDKQFGQRAGLDMEKVLPVISKGAAQSWPPGCRRVVAGGATPPA